MFLFIFNRFIKFTKTCFFLNRFRRHAARFTLTDRSYVVHQTPAFTSSTEHIKDSLDLLFGCPSFRSKFLSPTLDFLRLKDGKFLRSTTGKTLHAFPSCQLLTFLTHLSVNNKMNRKKRAYNWNHHTDDFANGVGGDRSSCRARYQQSSVDVFAKFVAIDQVSYFLLLLGTFLDFFLDIF